MTSTNRYVCIAFTMLPTDEIGTLLDEMEKKRFISKKFNKECVMTDWPYTQNSAIILNVMVFYVHVSIISHLKLCDRRGNKELAKRLSEKAKA